MRLHTNTRARNGEGLGTRLHTNTRDGEGLGMRLHIQTLEMVKEATYTQTLEMVKGLE